MGAEPRVQGRTWAFCSQSLVTLGCSWCRHPSLCPTGTSLVNGCPDTPQDTVLRDWTPRVSVVIAEGLGWDLTMQHRPRQREEQRGSHPNSPQLCVSLMHGGEKMTIPTQNPGTGLLFFLRYTKQELFIYLHQALAAACRRCAIATRR